MPTPRIETLEIAKSFPGVLALENVSVSIAPGEVHAFVGENGAGKSTLMKILSGALQPDSGSININGRKVDIRNASDAQRMGVATVYQELNLVDDLSVAENVFLGRWPKHERTRRIDFRQLSDNTKRLLDELAISLPTGESVGQLTIARQQTVEIAKALSLDARVLILDEPSAVLTPHELTNLFRIVRELKQRNVSVLYISHRLEEVFDIADTVTVLRDGRHISTRPIADVNRQSIVAEMVGRELKDEFPPQVRTPGRRVLQVQELNSRGRFSNVTFDIRAGEVFALTGLVGSGRSSVGKALFGALPVHGGQVKVNALSGPFKSPRKAMKAGVAMLPEDRKREGLLLHRTVRENTTLAHLSAVSRFGYIQSRKEDRLAQSLSKQLRIKTPTIESYVANLSGGNQQKVLLARWMSRPHCAMILDEPTRGVDVGAKYEIYTLINQLAAEGAAVMMITSELPEAIGMSDRIGVMHEGRLAGILENHDRSTQQTSIMNLAAGRRSSESP